MHCWPASSAVWLQFVSVSFTVGRGIGHRCAIVSVASLLTCMYIGSTQGDTPHKTRACCITEKPARKTLATALDRWKDPTRSSMTPLTPSHPPCVVSPHAHQSGTSHCPNFCLTHRGSWQQQRNTHCDTQRAATHTRGPQSATRSVRNTIWHAYPLVRVRNTGRQLFTPSADHL